VHIHYLRDIPLILGVIAVLTGLLRRTETAPPTAPSEYSDPQWMCRVVFYFVGFVLIGFGVLGNYSPH
jgi:hypothetical protein